MTRSLLSVCAAVFAASVGVGVAKAAAQAPSAEGHWVGTVQVPNMPLDVEIDLKAGTPWVGTISVPAQGLKGFPLAVGVEGTSVTLEMKSVPGVPTFKGTLSASGALLSGDFTQGGGGAVPFEVKRTGDAVIAAAVKNGPIGKEFEGRWAGALDIQGKPLRLEVTLANGADGATGKVISIDQGGVEIAVGAITQAGTHLEFTVPNVGGGYKGDLKDGKIVGMWSQGPGTLPLELSRPTP